MNITIKDFKKIYEQIEIEITPDTNTFGTFINIPEEDESLYHIYFNDRNEEIKRNYLYYGEYVSKIRIIMDNSDDNEFHSFNGLFSECKCIESINFNKFNRNNIYNMSHMFNECSSLQNINLSKFNTDNTTNMVYMFSF